MKNKFIFIFLSFLIILTGIIIFVGVDNKKYLNIDNTIISKIEISELQNFSINNLNKYFNNLKQFNYENYNMPWIPTNGKKDTFDSGKYILNDNEYEYVYYNPEVKNILTKDYYNNTIDFLQDYDIQPFDNMISADMKYYKIENRNKYNICLIYGYKQFPYGLNDNGKYGKKYRYVVNLLIVNKNVFMQLRLKTNDKSYNNLIYNIYNDILIGK